MKLQYYLRGLGTGILVTAILLVLAGSKEELTDAEIRARARELGMVEQGEQVLSSLTQVQADNQAEAEATEADTSSSAAETSEATAATEPPTSEPTAAPQATATPKPTVTPQATTTPNPTATPEPTATPQATTTPGSAGTPQSAESSTAQETVSITIRSGASSDSVSRDLEAVGLVEDAGDYDDYLCNNGYSRVISVGTYEIPIGSSGEEIAQIITKRR